MDLWRWGIFESKSSASTWNEFWWDLNYEYLGVWKPQGVPLTDGLDATGKFHIIDNVPYMRYFLASFLQLQFFQAMCEAGGQNNMHTCQLRGSKEAGQLLW